MASSSSSSSSSSSPPALSPPSSSSPNRKYNVFASFSGRDIGRSFVSDILEVIRSKGIHTSKMIDSLRINSSGVEAIRGSRIAIIMLSRNYASSPRYLNELVEIMKCREELNQVVVPIFDEFDPIDVRTQTGDFGNVFRETCKGKTKEETGRWSRALAQVATIAGYHSRNWDTEWHKMENIATEISNILKYSTPSRDLQRISNRLLHGVHIYCADKLQSSFASHLSVDFSRKRIASFVNCNRTLDVIEGAIASVVVISKDYLSSPSCLDKLVRVLQWRSQTGLQVVPVFYGISPLDVVVQENESAGRISVWSSALQELRDLPGHQSREESSECEVVEEIVKDVYEKLFPTEQIGINSRLLEIEQLLCKQPWGIRRIGIWGMPGIGKTTLAKAVFDQVSGGYEASCFIKHFDEAFHEKGPHRLLEEHFGKILKDLPRACSSITRCSLPKDKINKKRTLVVLDDVHNPLVAESFLGAFHWFGLGSLIIITSRDKRVYRHCQINHVYEVQSFCESEAMQLFSQCAFGKDIRELNLLELAGEVIDYANGNPLALSFYGKGLKGKKMSEIETSFLKLKLRTPHMIHDLFKSSYETLNDREKNIFLDIACFFRGEIVDYVMQLLEGCGFFPHVGIDVLVEKCLCISRGVTGCGNLGALNFYLKMTNWKTMKKQPGTEDIEGIFLDTANLLFDVKPTAFENMLNLRLLKIYSSSDENHYGLRLPRGLESLPDELRLLHWENYPSQFLPQDFDPRHLVELSMSYSKLRKLWTGTKNLDMLKIARLRHSQQLTEVDNIFKAQNIELIDLEGCTKLQGFPATCRLQHLRVVNLSGCREIKSFPEVSPNIEELYLRRTGIRELPISIGNATNLKKLYLTGCTNLVELSASIGNTTNLKVLDLGDCSSLKKLPSSIGNATNLQELNLEFCSSLVELPSSIGNATNLKKLCLDGCLRLVELPSSIGNATNLEILNLSYCSTLRELPSSIGNAVNLKKLYTIGCSRLVELPSSIGNVANLKILDLEYYLSFIGHSSSKRNSTRRMSTKKGIVGRNEAKTQTQEEIAFHEGCELVSHSRTSDFPQSHKEDNHCIDAMKVATGGPINRKRQPNHNAPRRKRCHRRNRKR
ncbi:hypothetical protein AALP_AA7G236700 [Arabis alpina]|uniref:TIR domain-containing protein n=1 Tax=Arabis alpina TaxID=50452 RepID=A0A087GK44_ARAAL|nr:hypothetical protein AALP_AA7G236700 [Arabis alpina]